jgi:hypothetical protein
VAERFIGGRPIGRVVGEKEMEFGWAKLNYQDQKKLKISLDTDLLPR